MEVEMCRSSAYELKLTDLLAHMHELLAVPTDFPLVSLPPLGRPQAGKLPVMPQLLT